MQFRAAPPLRRAQQRRQSFVGPSTDWCTPTHRRGTAQSHKRQLAATPTRHARTTCGWCPPGVEHRSFRLGTQATVSRCPRKSGAQRLRGHSPHSVHKDGFLRPADGGTRKSAVVLTPARFKAHRLPPERARACNSRARGTDRLSAARTSPNAPR